MKKEIIKIIDREGATQNKTYRGSGNTTRSAAFLSNQYFYRAMMILHFQIETRQVDQVVVNQEYRTR